MLYSLNENEISQLQFYDFADLKGKEKDLENLIADNINSLYVESKQLMTIFQERARQSEPDLLAIDKDGNLFVFELKRQDVPKDTTIQVMGYTQEFGQKNYSELNKLYKTYCSKKGYKTNELSTAHCDAFQLDTPLSEECFNRKQKMIIIGSSSDINLMNAVDYWKSNGLDIDFIPYRLYKINGQWYFDFFAKPYDYHLNIQDKKGIIFDTNRSYMSDAIWDMFKNNKVSAYGSVAGYVNRLNKGDYVFYYHIGYGIIGAGVVTDNKTIAAESGEEMYKRVKFLTPKPETESDIKYISPKELKALLNKNFYFASTIKSPYLSVEESEKLISVLNGKYGVQSDK